MIYYPRKCPSGTGGFIEIKLTVYIYVFQAFNPDSWFMVEYETGSQTNILDTYFEIQYHYNDVILGAMASQITSPTIVNWTVYSGADQRKHQSYASLAF